MLLFDEMDDLLSEPSMPFALFMGTSTPGTRGAHSKVFMNRLLEENLTPTLWTTNVARDINPAILRRMIFALEMRLPPPRIRARIWARQLASRNIEASDADTLALAHEFDAPPGVGAGATAAADLGDGGFDLVRRSVRSLSRVLGCERPPGGKAATFDPGLVEADIDLAALADRLTSRGERRFSLCLQGPPGTGKSAYARYLADRLGLEVMQKRASDLLSMWVGGTERHIAEAFAEARDAEALLIFDEADSLLADRRGRTQFLGSVSSQRNADLDGKSPLSICLYDQPWRDARQRGFSAIRVQGDTGVSESRVVCCGLSVLVRSGGTAVVGGAGRSDTRRL